MVFSAVIDRVRGALETLSTGCPVEKVVGSVQSCCGPRCSVLSII